MPTNKTDQTNTYASLYGEKGNSELQTNSYDKLKPASPKPLTKSPNLKSSALKPDSPKPFTTSVNLKPSASKPISPKPLTTTPNLKSSSPEPVKPTTYTPNYYSLAKSLHSNGSDDTEKPTKVSDIRMRFEK